MSTLKDRIVNNWHLMRIMRLGIGVMLLVGGFQSKDWVMGLFSTFFIYQAVTDTGCCGSAGCNTGSVRAGTTKKTNDEVIEYEEIK